VTRIVYVITELDVGGAEKAMCRLAAGIDRTRFEPRVVALTGRGPLGDELARAGIPVDWLDMRSALGLSSAALRLASLLRKHNADIVHSFLFHANMVGRLAAKIAGTPGVISSIRVAETRRHHWWFDRATKSFVGRYTCVCEAVRREAIRRLRVPEERVITIYNGVEPPLVDRSRRQVREELGIADEDFLFAFVGRLTEQKAPGDFLEAAARVNTDNPRTAFVLVGGGPLDARSRDLSEKLGVGRCVRFLGWRPDAADVMAASDALVLTSRWEGLPNVVLEGMALGKPIVASAVGGCPELVDPGQTGCLVPPGEIAEFARVMLDLCGNRERARDLGRRGREVALRMFPMSQMIEANQSQYEWLLWGGPGERPQ